jgi:hypothetical protein
MSKVQVVVDLAYNKGRRLPGHSHECLQSQNERRLIGKSWVDCSVRLQVLVHNEGCIEEMSRLPGCQMAGPEGGLGEAWT